MDTNHGVGGSYVLDPKTGTRTLTERTKDAESAPAPAVEPEPKQKPSKVED